MADRNDVDTDWGSLGSHFVQLNDQTGTPFARNGRIIGIGYWGLATRTRIQKLGARPRSNKPEKYMKRSCLVWTAVFILVAVRPCGAEELTGIRLWVERRGSWEEVKDENDLRGRLIDGGLAPGTYRVSFPNNRQGCLFALV